MKLTIKRAGEANPLEKTIVRKPVEFEVVDAHMLEGSVGYVSLAQFNEMADPKIDAIVIAVPPRFHLELTLQDETPAGTVRR